MALRILVTTGKKPRSAMWSASSSTVISMASRCKSPWPIRSSTRPGVATTISTPSRSACTWRVCDTPPKMVVTRRFMASAKGRITAVIWVASSRVGARTNPSGRPPRRLPPESSPASLATMGMLKARVLPEPVLPRPKTSLPERVSGNVST